MKTFKVIVSSEGNVGKTSLIRLWGRVFADMVGARHAFVSAKTGEHVSPLFQLLAESGVNRAALVQR